MRRPEARGLHGAGAEARMRQWPRAKGRWYHCPQVEERADGRGDSWCAGVAGARGRRSAGAAGSGLHRAGAEGRWLQRAGAEALRRGALAAARWLRSAE
eukprot:8080211-Heterocapsa_arctica.AAC.1